MKISLDVDNLTFGDMADFEDEVGEPLLSVVTKLESGDASAKALIGLVWICGRAEDESFTIADARKLKITELEVDVGDDAADPPNDGD